MAIVSIKSQRVTFYDADGWILRAPVSTGTTEYETPAGVFAIVQKKKDHHSNMYDDAWRPHMQRITWTLSFETNYRTEFVAVLSNHPQGGFVTCGRSRRRVRYRLSFPP